MEKSKGEFKHEISFTVNKRQISDEDVKLLILLVIKQHNSTHNNSNLEPLYYLVSLEM